MARSLKRAAGGVIATWVRVVVATVVGLVQAPILFDKISRTELGVWYLFYAAATFISLSDLGLAATFARAVAYLRGSETLQRNPERHLRAIYRGTTLGELYASAFVATAALGLLFALVALPLAVLYFSRALPGQTHLMAPLIIFLSGVVIHLAANIPSAYLSGSGEVASDNAIRTATSLLGFALVIFVVPIFRTLECLCAIYVVEGLAALATSQLALRGRLRLPEMSLSLSLIRGMVAESASAFLSRVGTWMIVESTLLVAGYFLGPSGLADFGLLRQMVSVGASVVIAIPVATAPHMSAAHAAGDRERVMNLYLATIRYALVANILWTAGLLLWGKTVIGLLVGSQHFLGMSVLLPLVLASLLELHAAVHAYVVWNLGRWPFAPTVIGAGVLNLVFGSGGAALAGYPGLVWGSFAAQALTIYWVYVMVALRQMRVALFGYLRDPMMRAAAYAVGVLSCGWGIRELARPLLSEDRRRSMVVVLGAALATALLAVPLAWRILLTPGDRGYFRVLVRMRAPGKMGDK